MAGLRFTELQSRPMAFLDRSYWIPGSYVLKTDTCRFQDQ